MKHFFLLASIFGCLQFSLLWPVSLQLLQSSLPSFVVSGGRLAPAVVPAAPAALGGGLPVPAAPVGLRVFFAWTTSS